MSLLKFPSSALEKLINKKSILLTLENRSWFVGMWKQKPYKKHFLEEKAQVLVTLIVKSKAATEDEFEEMLSEWNPKLHPAEKEMLKPFLQSGSGIDIQWLIKKGLSEDRLNKINNKLEI